MNDVRFEFEVYSEDYVQGGSVSSDIKKYLHQIGINQKLIRKIVICSYEAEMNIIIHSLGGNLILEIKQDLILLISSDKGPGIKDITLALTAGYSTAGSKAREMGFGAGMGLPNMKKNSDLFEITSCPNGTNIKMSYYI